MDLESKSVLLLKFRTKQVFESKEKTRICNGTIEATSLEKTISEVLNIERVKAKLTINGKFLVYFS